MPNNNALHIIRGGARRRPTKLGFFLSAMGEMLSKEKPLPFQYYSEPLHAARKWHTCLLLHAKVIFLRLSHF